jgi:hypothetical protein
MRLSTITKLSLVVVGLAAVTVFAQKTGDSMQAKRNNTNLYASEVREAYAQPVASVGSNDLLTITEVKKNHYRVRTVSGVEGFVQKNDVSKVAVDKSRSFTFGDAHIEGYLTTPAPVFILDTDGSDADPISLNRSFKEALKENTDKETIERLTIR